MAFEDKTDEQLIEENVALKRDIQKIQAKRQALADELRKRDLNRGVKALYAKMSEQERAAMDDMIKGGSGNVTVTPPPLVISMKPAPVDVPEPVPEPEPKKSLWDRIRRK